MKITCVEWPTGLVPNSPEWIQVSKLAEKEQPDLLITNEMPFGSWAPAADQYDNSVASNWVNLHENGLNCLKELGIPCILSSRPILTTPRLANEAYIIDRESGYQQVHHKHYFPEEKGFFEKSWFEPTISGFDLIQVGELKVGVLLCTELMFNEWARHYRRKGASLIAVPRATGVSSNCWHAAAKMAAIVSGCYVVSSNRVGFDGTGVRFGGNAFAYSPNGELLGETTESSPTLSFVLDKETVQRQQCEYPCYVSELL